MKQGSPSQQARWIGLAQQAFELGARVQVLEKETPLSREKLLRIYWEVCKKSPQKGMLPYNLNWFLAWQPNIHGSLLMAYYEFFKKETDLSSFELLIRSYRAYREEVSRHKNYDERNPIISFTRAWILLRFLKERLPTLAMTGCTSCGGRFVAEAGRAHAEYHCGFCHMPSRAGRKRRVNR